MDIQSSTFGLSERKKSRQEGGKGRERKTPVNRNFLNNAINFNAGGKGARTRGNFVMQ
jgi:hypothetical protein